MKTPKRNEAATQLWEQLFARMAEAEDAAIVDPEHDDKVEEAQLRSGLAEAGWSQTEIEARLESHLADLGDAPLTSPGVAPHVEIIFNHLCDEVEAAMGRLELTSGARVARGVEPRVGPYAAMTNVIMTDQAVVTVGSFLFRFCGLVSRAFVRTLRLNPWIWESPDYSEEKARGLLRSDPQLTTYWMQIFLSYAATGTHILAPFRPATKDELLHFEQVARAMEIFAVAHEYGHHHHDHGRRLEDEPKREEFHADQFALRIGYEVEQYPQILPNPYLASGAGGVVLLLALETLKKYRELITGTRSAASHTHPTALERLAYFDSVAVLRPEEFAALKGFRTVSAQLMAGVDAELSDLFQSLPSDLTNRLREFIR